MLFNSLDFAIFLPIVFILYWFITNRNLKLQNLLIVFASYLFYGWWDWRFLCLILFSTLIDYLIGCRLSNEEKPFNRKILLWISITVNLGFLGFFKYYNFFLDNFINAFTFFGMELNARSLNIILPVGISFYTFQTLSYTIDVYKRKLEPTRDFIEFAAFVCFFPQLVAGPIERATNLLPQFQKKRVFSSDNAIKGIRLILWGLFKKVVIADAVAPSVDEIFNSYQSYPSSILILGAVLFSFQIYCDFSGYSMIARGVSKMFGFELMINFNFPYFSRNIGEFWRRWHISLSTWFRDYLYIPLGGSRGSKSMVIRNVLIIFLVSGFWHGANWTFIAWGGIHALLFIPSVILDKNRKFTGDIQLNKFYLLRFRDLFMILKTFSLATLCWIFFRADDVYIAVNYITRIFAFDFRDVLFLNPYDNQPLGIEYYNLTFFVILEYLLASQIIDIFSKNKYIRISIDIILFTYIILNTQIGSNLSFIYFQF